MFRAVRNDDLRGFVDKSVVLFKLFANRLTQRQQPRGGRILGMSVIERSFRRVNDMFGGIEIGFTYAEGNDGFPRRFHCLCLCGNRERQRGRERRHSGCNSLLHKFFSVAYNVYAHLINTADILKKKQSANKLNAQIDRLIEQEIEKARKRAEAESRKNGKGGDKKVKTEPSGASKVGKVEKYNLNNEDRQLSGSFEKNRGILPMPITGPYVIVSHYGQYKVDGLKNVKLDNKGIDIKGKPGAKARAIFDGEVSAIFKYNGLNNVLVRHGNYISVYCNSNMLVDY